MVEFKGGRGKKAPYEQTHLRVPLPVRERVQAIINSYRNFAFGQDYETVPQTADANQVYAALDLLSGFIADSDIKESYNKPTRDNKNLKRFEGWLLDQL